MCSPRLPCTHGSPASASKCWDYSPDPASYDVFVTRVFSSSSSIYNKDINQCLLLEMDAWSNLLTSLNLFKNKTEDGTKHDRASISGHAAVSKSVVLKKLLLELERGLNSWDWALLFQWAWVQFSASALGSTQAPVTLAPEDLTHSSGFWGNLYLPVYTNRDIHIYTYPRIQKSIFKKYCL